MNLKTRKTVTLPDETIKYIDQLAKIEKRNFSNMIVSIVERFKRASEQLQNRNIFF